MTGRDDDALAKGLYDEIDSLRALLAVRDRQIGAMVAVGNVMEQKIHHAPWCWITRGGPGDGRCTCSAGELLESWRQAVEGTP